MASTSSKVRATLGLCFLVVAGCQQDVTTMVRPIPSVTSVRVQANPLNVLSAVVSFRVANVDSARVIYSAPGDGTQETPFFPADDDTVRIVTLGLRPSTTYSKVVEVVGSGLTVKSDTVRFTTGPLPVELKLFTATVKGTPQPGYTILSFNSTATAEVAHGYALGIDGAGELRWYRHFPEGLVTDCRQWPNGNFTAFIGSSPGWLPLPGYYSEFKPSGEEVRKYALPQPTYTDNHELLLTFRNDDMVDKVHIFGYDIRPTDLTRFGGLPNAAIAGHSVYRTSASGVTEFNFSAYDHWTLDDWIEEPQSFKLNPTGDFDHPNSLDIDTDGNYIVSWRSLAAVTKIDARTGALMWQLGGVDNQFAILNDPFGDFNGQHSVRALPNGNLLMYDNGLRHSPPESRAVEYHLDLQAKTATMVWQYRDNPASYTPYWGSVQRLRNGDTLVGFIGAGHVVQATTDGRAVWEATLRYGGGVQAGYRAWRIGSLYEFQAM